MQTVATVHPAAERAVRLAASRDPAASRVMRGVLNELVHEPTGRSKLARSGFPLELAFTSADATSLRFTLEIESLLRAFDRLAPGALPDHMREAAGPAPGGWLGARVRGSHLDAKLYVETNDHRWLALAGCAEPPVAARLTMTAFDAKSGCLELYFRARALGITGVHALFGDATGEVLDVIAVATGRPLRGALPSSDTGFSIVPATGRFTLYGFAGSVFGSDGHCREAILRVAASRGWSFPFYAELTEPLQFASGPARHHTMFGVAAAPGERPSITFGVTPP